MRSQEELGSGSGEMAENKPCPGGMYVCGVDRNDQISLVPCGGQGDTEALIMATRPCRAGVRPEPSLLRC